MSIGFPNGKTRAAVKRKKARAESAVKVSVREQCVARDGYCRYAKDRPEVFAECRGLSEWAHLEDKKRARTRGMAPEDRHTTEKSMMLCARHHRDYDEGRLFLLVSTGCANATVIFGRTT